MELRNGYKETEVGVIPESWEVSRLPGVIWFQEGPGLRKWQFKDKGLKVINITNLQVNGILNLDKTVRHISWEECEKMYRHFLIDENDVVMASSGNSYCKTSVVRKIDLPLLMNTSVIRFKPLQGIDYNFMLIYLKSKYFKEQIDLLITGGAQPNFGPAHLKKILIPLPTSEEEQTAIATSLSDTDALIQSLEKLIGKKRSIKQGTMQELLKPKETWTVKTLGELFEFSGGFTASRDQLSNEGYCYLHYGDIHGATKTYIDIMSEYIEVPKLQIELKMVSRKSLLKDGDVVFVDASEDDEGTSRHIVIKNSKDIPYISGLHTIVAKSKDNTIDNEYKRYCFQSSFIKSQFKFFAVGTKVSGISKANIVKIEISIPPKDEQIVIATILSEMDSEITALENKLAKYKMVKQGMMQNLLTGRIRLV